MKLKVFLTALFCTAIITTNTSVADMCEIGVCEDIAWIAWKGYSSDEPCPGTPQECKDYDESEERVIFQCIESEMTALLETKCFDWDNAPESTPWGWSCWCRIIHLYLPDGNDSLGSYDSVSFDVPGNWISIFDGRSQSFGCWSDCAIKCAERLLMRGEVEYFFQGL
ncbi:MAG: hypothetical protein FWG80_04120 [Alphaproteobacteria bacterium]|nr:hypothetical protein [Alphaproteobacteria bacterium]